MLLCDGVIPERNAKCPKFKTLEDKKGTPETPIRTKVTDRSRSPLDAA